ncbi:RHS repeat domain-containing protein [Rahnella victoriana]|uniref:RHS repeat domain-containing protein n=1 Tax=Rahnella victoriana TaxID=1510570 RepID=UPI001E376DF1|nr:RHS repeat-associated core domain-containing protein [Rahnella victoriana]UHM89760.1 RHS domain-containing protein [Rahnella victoriana]
MTLRWSIRITHQRDTRSDRPLSRAFRGLTLAFDYDMAGRIARMQAGDLSPLEIEYDAGGRERLRHSGAGFVQSQGYSATGMLLHQAAGRDGGQYRHLPGGDGAQMSGSAVNRRWAYDGAYNLLSLDDDRWGTSQFDYDSNDQITRSASGGMMAVEERFRYDANLNIREQSRLPHGAMSSFEQVQQRQACGRVVSRGEDDYRYDAAGRLTEKCRYRDGYRPQRWRYRWDAHDRLSELMTPSGVRWRYSYDPFGRRIRKQKVGAENAADTRPAGTEYRWSGDQMIAETPVYADGTVAYDEGIQWLYAPGSLTPAARYQKGQLHYVVSDHMGTPRELLTAQGKVAWAGRLSTWGEVTEWPVAANDADKLSCNLRFAGQYADEESGLHYNRFRYYDNGTGQYLSPDPIGLLGGVNPYGYVHNPLSWVDPLGLAGKDCCETRKNSAGDDVIRRYVSSQDDLLAEAEKAAGGNLDSFDNYKPDWYQSSDGKRKIEWNPYGHANTNEGPHVTIRDYDGRRYPVKDKIFIEGRDVYDGKF